MPRPLGKTQNPKKDLYGSLYSSSLAVGFIILAISCLACQPNSGKKGILEEGNPIPGGIGIVPKGYRFYPATDDCFLALGLYRVSGDGLRYDWPGFTLSLKVNSPGSICVIRGHAAWYDIYEDGKISSSFKTKPDQVLYPLGANSISRGMRTVSLYKRSEAYSGVETVLGILIPRQARLGTRPPRPKGIIEVIGDSITAGYGIESEDGRGHADTAYENSGKTYAAILARDFDCQVRCFAASGLGLTRNYAEPDKRSYRPMPDYYGLLIFNEPESYPSIGLAPPDACIIALGHNDVSTSPYPTKDEFQAAYRGLLRRIWSRYGDVPILCLSLGLGPLPEYISSLVAELKAQGKNSISYVNLGAPGPGEMGSDGHPNYRAHIRFADLARPAFQDLIRQSDAEAVSLEPLNPVVLGKLDRIAKLYDPAFAAP